MASKKRKCEQRDDLPSASYPRRGLFGSTRRGLNPYPLDSTVVAAAAPGSPLQEAPPQEGAEVRRLVVPLSRESLISLLCSAAASNPSILKEIRRANHHALSHPALGSASSHHHRHRRDQKLGPNPNPDPRNPGVRINGNGEGLYNFFSQYDNTGLFIGLPFAGLLCYNRLFLDPVSNRVKLRFEEGE